MAKPAALLELPPATPTLDELTLLNEVIQKRKQEVMELGMQVENLRARLTSERVQWAQQKSEEEVALRTRAEALERAYAQKQQRIDEDIRHAQLSLENQRLLERDAEQLVIEAKKRLEELDVLAQERVEVQTLRRQVEERAVGIEERWADAHHAFSKGQDAVQLAERLTAEVQTRTLALNEREAAVQHREDAVTLREHQMEKVEAVLNQRLAQEVADGRGGSGQEDRPGAESAPGGTEQGPEADHVGQSPAHPEGVGEPAL